jgi:hypothetical protein
MSLLAKLRPVPVRAAGSRTDPAPARAPGQPLHAPPVRQAAQQAAAEPAHAGRFSNGLKEFLWHLDGVGRGQLLDLGQISQATVNFFIERGFKVYSEDFVRSWQVFIRGEEEALQRLPAEAKRPDVSAGAQTERFLEGNLGHGPDSFDAILLWDLLDYLDKDAVARVVGRVSRMLRDGGAIFAIFHTRLPEAFHRYRVLDGVNLEIVPAPAILRPQHVYQNREIQVLFERFRSSKAFVGRDQLREAVFVK